MLTKGDKSLLHSLGYTNIHVDDIEVHEDCIIPFRIYVLMNNAWDVYNSLQKSIRKLRSINDKKVLRRIFNSIKRNGWIEGCISVATKDFGPRGSWYIVDGRHRYACVYVLGLEECYVKPRKLLAAHESIFIPEKTMTLMKFLPTIVSEALKCRHKILQVLKSIKDKKGSNHVFSAYHHIPELGIRGSHRYIDDISQLSGFLQDKVLMDFHCNMGMKSVLASKFAKQVYAFEPHDGYRKSASLLAGYHNVNNISFIPSLREYAEVLNHCDIVVMDNDDIMPVPNFKKSIVTEQLTMFAHDKL